MTKFHVNDVINGSKINEALSYTSTTKPGVLPVPQSLPLINFSCQKKDDENKSFTNNLWIDITVFQNMLPFILNYFI